MRVAPLHRVYCIEKYSSINMSNIDANDIVPIVSFLTKEERESCLETDMYHSFICPFRGAKRWHVVCSDLQITQIWNKIYETVADPGFRKGGGSLCIKGVGFALLIFLKYTMKMK